MVLAPLVTLVGLLAFVVVLLFNRPSGAEEAAQTDDSARVIRVESPDGRTVFCVLWDGVKEGAIDCDWLNAR